VSALLCADILSAGNFPTDFQEALRLGRAPGKEAEAEAAFLELAARKTRRTQGTDAALEMASLCALRRRDFEAAEKHAARVKEPSLRTLCRMRISQAQRRWNDILDAVGNQDLETWPDRLIYDAAMCRGRAYALRGAAAAERDFLLARKSTFDVREQAFANLALGNFYRDCLKNESKARAAYKEVADSSATGAAKYDGVIAYAILLARQGHDKEAVAQLDRLPLGTVTSPHWRCRIHQAYGDVYSALSRADAAVAAYRKAIAVPDASKYLVRAIQKKIAAAEARTH